MTVFYPLKALVWNFNQKIWISATLFYAKRVDCGPLEVGVTVSFWPEATIYWIHTSSHFGEKNSVSTKLGFCGNGIFFSIWFLKFPFSHNPNFVEIEFFSPIQWIHTFSHFGFKNSISTKLGFSFFGTEQTSLVKKRHNKNIT